MGRGGLVAINFDQLGFRIPQGDFIIGNTAFDGIAKRRPSDNVDIGFWDKTKVQEPLTHRSSAVVTMDLGPAAGFYIIEHATSASGALPSSVSWHCGPSAVGDGW